MKEKKLELYYFEQCPYCQLVISALRITGLEGKVVFLNIKDDHKIKETLIKVTNKSTVPCLFIDDTPMYESVDIVDWIHQYARELQKE